MESAQNLLDCLVDEIVVSNAKPSKQMPVMRHGGQTFKYVTLDQFYENLSKMAELEQANQTQAKQTRVR